MSTSSVTGRQRGSTARLPFQPRLLLLAPFLATMPIFIPNLRSMRDLSGNPSEFGNVATAMMVTCLLVAVGFMVLARSGRRLEAPVRPVVRAAAGVYLAMQVVLWTVGILWPGASGACTAAIGAAMGVCLPPLLVAWMSCCTHGFRSTMFNGALVCLLTVAIAGVIAQLPLVAAAVAWCACAGVGAFAPLVPGPSAGSGDDGTGATGDEVVLPEVVPLDGEGPRAASPLAELLSSMWVPLLGIALCVAVSSMGETTVGGTAVHGEYVGLVVAALIALVLCCVPVRLPLVQVVDKAAVPVLVAVSIVLGALPEFEALTFVNANLVFAPLCFISLYGVASIAALRGYSRMLVAGTVLSASCVAMLVGSVANYALGSADLTGPAMKVVIFIYYGVILVNLGATALALISGRFGASEAPEVMESARRECLEQIADERGLTPREREVFEYLALGYSSQSVAQTLLISRNTVGTHVRNIYRKLGVSTREELLLYVNGLK